MSQVFALEVPGENIVFVFDAETALAYASNGSTSGLPTAHRAGSDVEGSAVEDATASVLRPALQTKEK